MGYADLSQTNTGLHMRYVLLSNRLVRSLSLSQRIANEAVHLLSQNLPIHQTESSSSTLVGSPYSSESAKLCSRDQPDLAMGDSGIRRAVVAKLSSLYPGVYTDNNIGLVGTHQHAGVGGFVEVWLLL
jgi:Neutral/alkaline non-lysosomal ceramidase, N-terminal